MQSQLLMDQAERTHVLVFDSGDEVMAELKKFAERENLNAASFTAIGAFRSVDIGWFDLKKQDYKKISIREQVEVLSLIGNIAEYEGGPKIHAHLVVGKQDGTAHGGHLLAAHVRPTLEVVLTESPERLRRQFDPRFGIALLETEKVAG
jgi:predicted DNA-binding protein with PD1-like motif